MPTLRDGCGVGSGVEDLENAETSFGEKTFVFAGRAEEVIADGTAGGEFLMRNDAADNERVAEEKTGAGLEDASESAKQGEPAANVAENVVGKGRIERGIAEGKWLGAVGDLKLGEGGEILGRGELRGVVNAWDVEVKTKNMAADAGSHL